MQTKTFPIKKNFSFLEKRKSFFNFDNFQESESEVETIIPKEFIIRKNNFMEDMKAQDLFSGYLDSKGNWYSEVFVNTLKKNSPHEFKEIFPNELPEKTQYNNAPFYLIPGVQTKFTEPQTQGKVRTIYDENPRIDNDFEDAVNPEKNGEEYFGQAKTSADISDEGDNWEVVDTDTENPDWEEVLDKQIKNGEITPFQTNEGSTFFMRQTKDIPAKVFTQDLSSQPNTVQEGPFYPVKPNPYGESIFERYAREEFEEKENIKKYSYFPEYKVSNGVSVTEEDIEKYESIGALSIMADQALTKKSQRMEIITKELEKKIIPSLQKIGLKNYGIMTDSLNSLSYEDNQGNRIRVNIDFISTTSNTAKMQISLSTKKGSETNPNIIKKGKEILNALKISSSLKFRTDELFLDDDFTGFLPVNSTIRNEVNPTQTIPLTGSKSGPGYYYEWSAPAGSEIKIDENGISTISRG